ncbi:MAG: hypothetical protein J7497_00845 [Chitinophagaceae bacterium]|nr:hypothetical protein [Chitinophagaceae bacterium]
MKTIPVIFIVLIILAVISLAGLEWLKRIEDKHPGEIKFSSTLDESKKNKFFVSNYRPLSNNIKLTQQSGTISFNSVFAERGWRMDTSGLYLFSKKIPVNDYNIIINYSETSERPGLNFDLVHFLNDSTTENSGVMHYGNHILLHRTAQLQDTIWFRFLEKSKDTAQEWVEADDLIGFSKVR